MISQHWLLIQSKSPREVKGSSPAGRKPATAGVRRSLEHEFPASAGARGSGQERQNLAVTLAVEQLNRRMLRARDAIDRAYAQPLHIQSLAAVAHVSEGHFIR